MRLIPRGTVTLATTESSDTASPARSRSTWPTSRPGTCKERPARGSSSPATRANSTTRSRCPPSMETGRTCRVCVMGTADREGPGRTEHVVTYSSREQNDQVIAVVEPERLGLRLDRPTVLVEPGKTADDQVRPPPRRRPDRAGDRGRGHSRGRQGRVGGAGAGARRRGGRDMTLRFAADCPRAVPVAADDSGGCVMQDGKPVTAERKLELVAPR